MNPRAAPLLSLLPLLLTSPLGCGEDEPEQLTLDIPFEARLGNEPFACGRTYTGLGMTATTYEPMEFRLYLHDVRLLSKDGREVPITLQEDGVWQTQGAALLDFADRTGLCANGTAGTNTRVRGTAPAGAYQGLILRVGLPESLNHQDVSTAPAPLNDTSLFWGWRYGYLFARIEGRTMGLQEGHFLHLGSTDCAPPAEGQGNGTSGCAFPNRPEYRLDSFKPGVSKVVLDVAAVLAGSNLDVNADAPNTAIGCMSQQEDPDCAPMFNRLGLAFGNAPANPSAQVFIRLE
jgi:uncharacterized repeat protein (TIGR04052 family)